jgi:putative phosphoesterase
MTAAVPPVRVGVVSDTHGHVPYATEAVSVLRREKVDVVLHCGDIGTPDIVWLFTDWPTHFVFGNCDYEESLLRGAIRDAGLVCHERFGDIELAGRRIALIHSDDGRLFRQVISSGEYDLVCYGHTHIAKLEQAGKTLVLNPGALYRAEPHSLAIVELPALTVRHIQLPGTGESL